MLNLSTLYWLYGDDERALPKAQVGRADRQAELKKLEDTRTIDFAAPGVHPKALEMARALGVR